MQLSEFKNIIANMPVLYQAATSKRSTWNAYIDGNNESGQALRSIFGNLEEVTISRKDLKDLANKSNLAQFIWAVIIWGYPNGMRGNHVFNIINKFEELTNLLSIVRMRPVLDWEKHYKAVNKIPGLGLSTYTKFLAFLSTLIYGQRALILDNRIIRVAHQGIFKELSPLLQLKTSNAVRFYPQYLSCIHDLANNFAVSAEEIEFFLFEFGLNLKPL